MDVNFLVRVSCMTYNHAPYIEDAMNGFCMQETTFPFVCTIVDDASTDGEQDVIRKYLKEHFDLQDKSVVRNEETDDYTMIFARHKINMNCYFAVLFLKYNHYSIRKSKLPYIAKWNDNAKYIAVCEGDDCWIDKYKLQEQVSFLENNEDFVLIHSNYDSIDSSGFITNRHSSTCRNIPDGNVTDTLFLGYYIRTLTICYRNIPGLLDVKLPEGAFHGDKFLFYMLSIRGKVKFVDKVTGFYRVLPESASHSKDMNRYKVFSASVCKLDYFMADYLNIKENTRIGLDLYWLNKTLMTDNYELFMEIHKAGKAQKLLWQQNKYRLYKFRPYFTAYSFAIRSKIECIRKIIFVIRFFGMKKKLTSKKH